MVGLQYVLGGRGGGAECMLVINVTRRVLKVKTTECPCWESWDGEKRTHN